MQRKFLKIISIIFLISLFAFALNVKATEDETSTDDVVVGENSEENSSDENNEESEEQNQDEESEGNEEEDKDSEDEENSNTTSHDEDVGTTGGIRDKTLEGNTTSSTYTTPDTVQPTSSYSTVTPIPEANLSLNNILNVILIAVGVVIILFAIAILIRLK